MTTVNIELEEGVKTFELPTSWDEVTVGQFMKIYELQLDKENELMGTLKLISALSGIESDILLMMDVDDFKQIATEILFITTPLEKNDSDYVEINGDKFYLYRDFNKLTTGEVITIEMIIDGAKNNINSVMPDLLCLFLRKKKEDGTFEKFTTDLMNRKEMFMNVPVNKIYHIFDFFFHGKVS
jgi:hypothetical protein